MNYIEVVFKFEPLSNDGREIIAAILSQISFDSFSDTKEGVNAYIPEMEFDQEAMLALINPIKEHFDSFHFYTKVIEAQNWNATWEKNFEPIVVSEHCRIRAPFHELSEKYDFDIIIEPKMSFGTGHHATTVLMLKLMHDIDFRKKTVLDMGCGTGILGIFACLKNAEKVLGVDVDPWSFENTMENAQRNNVSNLTAIQGDASQLVDKTFDVILANINRNILLNDMEIYINSMAKGSILILSGFYLQDLPIISEKATNQGLKYLKHIEHENWIAIQFIRNE